MLLHNDCNGTFNDATAKAGIAGLKGRAMGVTAADFDRDGYPDIYVANDKSENFLLHNQRDGTFREIAVQAGVGFGQNGENTSAMGPVFADFDGDGKVDLWISDSRYNRMYRNLGGLMFDDITERAGISQLAAQYVSWGTGAHDFDNDGLLDVFIVHGGLIHMVPQEHAVFRNAGKGKFRGRIGDRRPFLQRQDRREIGRPRSRFRGLRQRRQNGRVPDEPGRSGHPAAQHVAPLPGIGSAFTSWAERVTATASAHRWK